MIMTKYKVLLWTIIIDLTMVIFADAIETINTNDVDITTIQTGGDGLDFAWGFITTFKNLLTFQVTGLPDVFYLLFIVINFLLAFILAELVISAIKALPFT